LKSFKALITAKALKDNQQKRFQEDYKKWFLETQVGTEFPLGDPKPKQQPKGEEVVEEVDEFAEFVEN